MILRINKHTALLTVLTAILIFSGCNSIKNENANVTMDESTTVTDGELALEDGNKLYGFWVGKFEMDFQDEDYPIYEDDEFEYNKKINISIDKIVGERIEGHSVVSGNYRVFSGSIKRDSGRYFVEAREPGDHANDGIFKFQMNDTMLWGTWNAFDKKDSVRRKYELKRRIFQYDSTIALEEAALYVDYKKSKQEMIIDEEESDSFEIPYYATSTKNIYDINASNTFLNEPDVANLKKGDLLIIRNAIYARHGYAFKNKALRRFFDAQDWYIPVNSDITDELSATERHNIELLMAFEKNAEEYYDHFGRY